MLWWALVGRNHQPRQALFSPKVCWYPRYRVESPATGHPENRFAPTETLFLVPAPGADRIQASPWQVLVGLGSVPIGAKLSLFQLRLTPAEPDEDRRNGVPRIEASAKETNIKQDF